MNIFVSTTGRAGSTTFTRACAPLTNYTAAHQSRINLLGAERLAFPDRHIEADNRLAWFLGRLDALYGDRALYVHLHRDPEATARSFLKRFGTGITGVYYPGIVSRNVAYENSDKELTPDMRLAVCRDYVETVNSNIRSFIADRPNCMDIPLEDPKPGFSRFLDRIGAEGPLDQALAAWDVSYNANAPKDGAFELRPHQKSTIRLGRLPGKIRRVLRKLPRFLIEA